NGLTGTFLIISKLQWSASLKLSWRKSSTTLLWLTCREWRLLHWLLLLIIWLLLILWLLILTSLLIRLLLRRRLSRLYLISWIKLFNLVVYTFHTFYRVPIMFQLTSATSSNYSI